MSLYFIIAPLVINNARPNEKEFRITELIYWVLNLLWYSNSAFNFYLYCLTGTKFRADARKVLFQIIKPISELPSPSVNAQQSPINTETFNTETFNTETFNTETFNTETFNTETFNTETFNTETFNTETFNTETFNTKTVNTETLNTETFNTETFNTETFNTDTMENQIEDGNDF